jgi:tetratricopeptide (TPR) repeat protein
VKAGSKLQRPRLGNRDAPCAALHAQALAFSARGEYRRAEECLASALSLARRFERTRLDWVPVLLNQLGIVSKYLGKFNAAGRCYRLALRQAREIPQRGRDFFRANVYHNLGGLEHSRRRFARGQEYAAKGLRLRLRCVPAKHLAVASDRAALAAIFDGMERFAESEKLYQQALRSYRREYGSSHPEIAVLLNNLGTVYQATGRPRQAERYYIAAFEMKCRELGVRHPDLAVTMNNLALFYACQGKPGSARRWLERALRILENSIGNSHPISRAVRNNLYKLTQMRKGFVR